MTQRFCVRKIACILLSVLLIFLLAATVSRKAKEVDPTVTLSTSLSSFGTATPILGTLFILLLIGTALTDRKSTSSYDVSGSPLYRLLALFTVFAAACFVTTALYIGFTPVGHDTVNGCQFRYFLPLFPLLLYFVAPRASHSASDGRLATALALGGGAALNLLVLADLYLSRLL